MNLLVLHSQTPFTDVAIGKGSGYAKLLLGRVATDYSGVGDCMSHEFSLALCFTDGWSYSPLLQRTTWFIHCFAPLQGM